MEKLKCKIVNKEENFYSYIVIDKDYKIVTNGISSNEGWVINDAGGYHTKEDFDKLYGENNWEVDFSDMYSDESEKITGKQANKISSTLKKFGEYELRCRYEEIRYVNQKYITKNQELADKWKVFISKANGAAGLLSDKEAVSILGSPYLGRPKTVCTDSLIPIGNFNTKLEAIALMSYVKTKFLRYLVGVLKVSQNIYQNVYEFVPLQDFTHDSDIDWSKSISEIDQQLYNKYKLTKKERDFINQKIKSME